jgi:hypothetical protein
METERTQSVLVSPKVGTPPKREYRILRAKVIKILDTHFARKSDKLLTFENKMKMIQDNFKAMKDEELMEKHLMDTFDKNIPKNIDYPQYVPDLKSIVCPPRNLLNGSRSPLPLYQDYSVDKLCEYLATPEIIMICEDPIYFLGKEEYQTNPALSNTEDWQRRLVIIQENKWKNSHYKEYHQNTLSKSATAEKSLYYNQMSTANLGHTKEINYGAKQKYKNDLIQTNARKIKARNFTMNALVNIRKQEVNESRKDLEDYWVEGYKARYERSQLALLKQEEKIKFTVVMNHKKQAKSHQKLFENQKKQEEIIEQRKINFDIKNAIKDRISKENKTNSVQRKIEKAIIFRDYQVRKTLDLKYGGYDDENL